MNRDFDETTYKCVVVVSYSTCSSPQLDQVQESSRPEKTNDSWIKVAVPLKDGFLDFGIGSEMATCKELLQRSEEMKITWYEILAVGRVLQCLCGGRDRQFRTPVFVKKSCFHTCFRDNTRSFLNCPRRPCLPKGCKAHVTCRREENIHVLQTYTNWR
ncbi:hypothetical protein AVEN_197711-1 [Araneus ventricosus]|uniref:Uncharacterized protein n=1 Tax=Araneus ventricosus TaxID=182803 RepID=A0A4Y2CLU9_ARAVE|nr:hypothetical protein AVEN_197711-1 [Araneus ventricosus]